MMPPLNKLNYETIREIEKIWLTLRGEAPTESWRELALTIGDPVGAADSFSRMPEEGVLLVTREMTFDLGGTRINLPRVLTKTFTGYVAPSPSELEDLKKGKHIVIRGTKDAQVTWGMLHHSEDDPVTEWPQDLPRA